MQSNNKSKKFRSLLRNFGILTFCGFFIYFLLVKNYHHLFAYTYQFGSAVLAQNSQKQRSQPAIGKQGMVVTSQHLATDVGVNILKQGGNAIDAAVGVGYALAVVDPCCGNIGGGGFMTIQLADGKETFIYFRETAPIKATADMYSDKSKKSSRDGYLAAGIPGTVKGLEFVLAKYGTMPRQKVMLGAIALAKNGFILEPGDIKVLKFSEKKIKYEPEIARIFQKNGQVYQKGDRLIQSDLAQTLEQISQQGESAFYGGAISEKLVQASQNNGGIFTKEDFTNYQIRQSEPLHCSYREYEIITSIPPGGGITVCQMLNILEGYPVGKRDVMQLHRRLSAMLFAYADRNQNLGDPAFVKIPQEKLISEDYAATLREKITDKAIDPKSLGFKEQKEGENTTHYSIIDRLGNAVAVTYTINSSFGAGVVAPGTGIILNNEMDDFTTQPGRANQFGLVQGEPNRIEPGKRPASSMSPTIVKKNGKVILITGSPGGSTIPTTVLQVILGVVDEGKDVATVVNNPRIHYQGYPNVVTSEPNALSPEEVKQLTQMGYKIVPFRQWGVAESIAVNKDGSFVGGHDHRREAGSARGF
ncbi:MAG: gamma-glutamyltransferase [Xenococcaceae cyanobacterium]